MTEIGGKPVYTPITPVDNNAKPSSAPTQGGVGHGNLPPGPNVTWVKGVVKKDADTMAKRAAFTEANGAMGDRTQYITNQLADALSQTRISQGAHNRCSRRRVQPARQGPATSSRVSKNRARSRSMPRRSMPRRSLSPSKKPCRRCSRKTGRGRRRRRSKSRSPFFGEAVGR